MKIKTPQEIINKNTFIKDGLISVDIAVGCINEYHMQFTKEPEFEIVKVPETDGCAGCYKENNCCDALLFNSNCYLEHIIYVKQPKPRQDTCTPAS